MLVLSRKLYENIIIGEDIVVSVVKIGNDKVMLGINAPAGMRIDRQEVRVRIDAAKRGETLD